MRTYFSLTAIALVALSMSACDKKPTAPPTPQVSNLRIEAGAAPASAPDSWTPSADSASAPGPVATTPPTGERSNRAMTRAQESSAMPMAGQNNDHSAALSAAKAASRP